MATQRLRFVFGLLLTGALIGPASALSIQGTVRDTSGTPVQQALVVVTNEADPADRYTATTDAEGRYGISAMATVVEELVPLPTQSQLFQNWPNPFNPSTQLGYALEKAAVVELAIFNVLGQQVRVLDQGFREAGVYQLSWDGHDQEGQPLSAGVYLYRLQAGAQALVKKMVMLDGAGLGCCPEPALGGKGQAKSLGVKRAQSVWYTLEVTAVGISGYREEHLEFSEEQVFDITVVRLPEEQQDLAVVETDISGAATVPVSPTTGVTIHLVSTWEGSSSALSGVTATVQQVDRGSFVLLEDASGAILPTVEFIGDEVSGNISVPAIAADSTKALWYNLRLPARFAFPEESAVDTVALSQVGWYVTEHPELRSVLFYNVAALPDTVSDPRVILYSTNAGGLLHAWFLSAPGVAPKAAFLDQIVVAGLSTAFYGGYRLGEYLGERFAERLLRSTAVADIKVLSAPPATTTPEAPLPGEDMWSDEIRSLDCEIGYGGIRAGDVTLPVGPIAQFRAYLYGQEVTEQAKTVFLTDNPKLAAFEKKAGKKGRLSVKRPTTVTVWTLVEKKFMFGPALVRSGNLLTVHFVQNARALIEVEQYSFSPQEPADNEPAVLDLTLGNRSDLSIPEGFSVHVYDTSEQRYLTPQSGIAVAELAARGTHAMRVNLVFSRPGHHVLEVQVKGRNIEERTLLTPSLRVRDALAQRPVASARAVAPGTNTQVTEGYSPLEVVLSAENSSDPDGTIATYRWDANEDGIYDYTGQTKQVVLRNDTSSDQMYRFRLEVEDQTYLTAQTVITVTVHPNQRPVASFAIQPDDAASRVAGTPLTFDASASSDRETASSRLLFQWDFDGDGTYNTDLSSGNRVAHHTYATAGPKSVRLLVEDEHGNRGLSATPFPVYEGVVSLTGWEPDPAVSGQYWFYATTYGREDIIEVQFFIDEGPARDMIALKGGRWRIPVRSADLSEGAHTARVRAIDTDLNAAGDYRLEFARQGSALREGGGLPPGPGVAPGRTLTVDLPGGATMEFVWIEPGTFVMGTTEDQKQLLQNKGLWEDWSENEQPAHPVTISKGFYLGKYEITQGEWVAVMGSNPSFSSGANRPVERVSWNDVQAFIQKLNDAAGEALYRLPTEAEWEYACRAGTTTRWSFGDNESQLKDYAWYYDNARAVGLQYAQPVGTKLPNPWGLFDMHGNVWEWVQDLYGSYSNNAQVDPMGPSSGSIRPIRVFRGGDYGASAQGPWSASRAGNSPGYRYSGVGARLLRMETAIPTNQPPKADAGPDQQVVSGSAVTLSGSGSSDPDNNPLTYRWTQIGDPTVSLSDPTAAQPAFTPREAGTYVFSLVVNDGKVDSAPDEVSVTVEAGTATREVVLQPDGATGKDVFVGFDQDGENQTKRYYEFSNLYVGASFPGSNYNQNTKFRSYLEFALAGVPADAQIQSATLSLYCDWVDGRSENGIDVYKVTGAWAENDLTWNTVPPDAGVVLATTRVGEKDQWYSWNLTDLVKDWVSGGQNYGLMLRERNEGFNQFGVKRFVASEDAEAAHRPKLTIIYQAGSVGPSGKTISVDLPGGTQMEMVWIEPGTFTMGSPDSNNLEKPQHEVTLTKGFYLGKYEITQGQWQAVMGTTPWSGQSYVQANANNPAVYISWDDMQVFVHKLNVAAGDSLYRLPTEAEWEYACRAGTTTRRSFGDEESQLGQYAWYYDNAWNAGLQYAQPVGQKQANPWGLFDMHGNVDEWVQDWYGGYSSSSQTDPTGTISGSYRVIRGGQFSGQAWDMRSAYRGATAPGVRGSGLGARLLRTR